MVWSICRKRRLTEPVHSFSSVSALLSVAKFQSLRIVIALSYSFRAVEQIESVEILVRVCYYVVEPLYGLLHFTYDPELIDVLFESYLIALRVEHEENSC